MIKCCRNLGMYPQLSWCFFARTFPTGLFSYLGVKSIGYTLSSFVWKLYVSGVTGFIFRECTLLASLWNLVQLIVFCVWVIGTSFAWYCPITSLASVNQNVWSRIVFKSVFSRAECKEASSRSPEKLDECDFSPFIIGNGPQGSR